MEQVRQVRLGASAFYEFARLIFHSDARQRGCVSEGNITQEKKTQKNIESERFKHQVRVHRDTHLRFTRCDCVLALRPFTSRNNEEVFDVLRSSRKTELIKEITIVPFLLLFFDVGLQISLLRRKQRCWRGVVR